jgi:hypothetical protein
LGSIDGQDSTLIIGKINIFDMWKLRKKFTTSAKAMADMTAA